MGAYEVARLKHDFWLVLGLIMVVLYGIAAFHPEWSTQEGYGVDDLKLKYGLFKVCGFDSSSLYSAGLDDCYACPYPLPKKKKKKKKKEKEEEEEREEEKGRSRRKRRRKRKK